MKGVCCPAPTVTNPVVLGYEGQITPSGLKYAISVHVVPPFIEYCNDIPSPAKSGPSQVVPP